ncbi:hypothetical protein [Streptomyces laurentii]|uniref:hypothetical protein n=1 Tax=Streptomyces laurentii TaxID=39478 RepID=UPI0036A88A0F
MPTLVTFALDKGLDLLGTTLGGLAFAVVLLVIAVGAWLYRRNTATSPEPPRVRHFTLLRTEGADGSPVRFETTRPTGSKITHWVGGLPRLYELTDARLEDGTYVAEPLDQ